jgi:hypothetical protein
MDRKIRRRLLISRLRNEADLLGAVGSVTES